MFSWARKDRLGRSTTLTRTERPDAENAQLRAQLAGVGKERDDLRRENDRLSKMYAKATGRAPEPPPSFDADGLKTWSKNIGFLTDPRFLSAYKRGFNSGHKWYRPDGTPIHNIQWRVAVTCWAGAHGAQLPGDFVECGVNTGIYSLAICEYVSFNALDKKFYLYDTFNGMPEGQMTAHELIIHQGRNERLYPECYDIARENFAPFPNAHLVRGKIPDTLSSVSIDRVAYLSIDMNLAYPEKAALQYFWPKLATGAVVVFDDYAWAGCQEQKEAHDAFATSQGTEILTLPTGQGLLIKP
jgi:O-methyltransferase